MNGIRAAVVKGFLDYLREENPDIIGLQEVKATEEQNPIPLELASLGYHVYWHAAERKGYSGTAIFTKEKPLNVIYGMGLEMEKDDEGRITVAEFEDHYFLTVYTPNSKDDLSRLPYRQVWDRTFLAFLKDLESRKPVIFCGDLNVAHQEIDLANPRANIGEHGFTVEERSGFESFVKAGFIDTFRYLYPDLPAQYSWWSHFANSRARNIWWRIDYFLLSQSLKNKLKDAFIRPKILGSDHCPVWIIIDI